MALIPGKKTLFSWIGHPLKRRFVGENALWVGVLVSTNTFNSECSLFGSYPFILKFRSFYVAPRILLMRIHSVLFVDALSITIFLVLGEAIETLRKHAYSNIQKILPPKT